MWPPVADLNATLSTRLVSHLERIEGTHQLARDAGKVTNVGAVKFRREDALLERRFLDCHAGVLVERWLGIKALHVAGATQHEVPDHALGTARLLWGRRGGLILGQ